MNTSRADKITMVVAEYPQEIKTHEISDDIYRGLMQYYRSLPGAPMVVPRSRMAQDGEVGHVLNRQARFANYAVVDGRRIIPSRQARKQSLSNSIVQVDYDGRRLYGEVVDIFQHQQPSSAALELLCMRYMKPMPLPLDAWKE